MSNRRIPSADSQTKALTGLFIGLVVAAFCDVPGPEQEPWHRLLFGLTLCVGGVLAVRVALSAAFGHRLTFVPFWTVWLLLGQFFGTRVGFPFVRFDMFTTPVAAEQTHYIYRALHASGVELPFEPGALQRTLGYSRLLLGLHNHMAALEEVRAHPASPARLSEAETRVRQLLQTTAQLYNDRQPDDPIKRLDVYRAHWRSAQPDRLQDQARILTVVTP